MRRRRSRKDRQAGFALFIVMILVAMLAVGALSLLDMINLDIIMVGEERRYSRAKESAEGGLSEMLNDVETPDNLPGLSHATLTEDYVPPTQSPFIESAEGFEGRFELLRIVPLSESSHTLTRAVVHGLHTRGRSGPRASAEVDVEIYRVMAYRPGTILPRRHIR